MHCRKECPKVGHYLAIVLPTPLICLFFTDDSTTTSSVQSDVAGIVQSGVVSSVRPDEPSSESQRNERPSPPPAPAGDGTVPRNNNNNNRNNGTSSDGDGGGGGGLQGLYIKYMLQV